MERLATQRKVAPGNNAQTSCLRLFHRCPFDGPSHTPFGAHRALLAVTGAGPFGTFWVRHRQYGFSSESTWRRHQTSNISDHKGACRVPGTRGWSTSVDRKRTPGPKRRLDSTCGVCQENRYARAGLHGPSLEVVTELDPTAYGDLDKSGPGLFRNRRGRGAG